MLLRSVTKHIKEQNWYAVAIDFLIVVVGVFVGLQVTNWNESRADRELGLAYLQRIHDDVSTDIDAYEIRMGFWQQVIDFGQTGLTYAENRETNDLTHWDVLLAYFQASQIWEFYASNATYSELTSAGDLRLIQNVKIRNTLTRYYTNSSNQALTERPRYREDVRGNIPLAVQSYIWENCYNTYMDKQFMIACQSPIEHDRAREIVDNLSANSVLMSELRYWMSTMKIAVIIGSARIDEANILQQMIESELGIDSTQAKP